jgi:uroporphyrinogen decarboxylase
VSLDRARALQHHGPVQGNLDPNLLVAGGAALERAVRAILDALGRGPFVFNLGHGILPETPIGNVTRLGELLRGGP